MTGEAGGEGTNCDSSSQAAGAGSGRRDEEDEEVVVLVLSPVSEGTTVRWRRWRCRRRPRLLQLLLRLPRNGSGVPEVPPDASRSSSRSRGGRRPRKPPSALPPFRLRLGLRGGPLRRRRSPARLRFFFFLSFALVLFPPFERVHKHLGALDDDRRKGPVPLVGGDFFNGVERRHAAGHAAENRVLTVEVPRRFVKQVELGAVGVSVSRVGHGEHAAGVVGIMVGGGSSFVCSS